MYYLLSSSLAGPRKRKQKKIYISRELLATYATTTIWVDPFLQWSHETSQCLRISRQVPAGKTSSRTRFQPEPNLLWICIPPTVGITYELSDPVQCAKMQTCKLLRKSWTQHRTLICCCALPNRGRAYRYHVANEFNTSIQTNQTSKPMETSKPIETPKPMHGKNIQTARPC